MTYGEKKHKFINGVLDATKGICLGLLLNIGLNPIDSTFFYNHGLQSEQKVQQELSQPRKVRDVAVLTSGTGALQSSFTGTKKDISTAYNTLKERGYNDKDIVILSNTIPKGRNPDSGITARPTPDNLRNVLDFLDKNSQKDSSLTFYFTGHGGKKSENKDFRIALGQETMDLKELSKYIAKFKGEKILIFDQCYSGGFAKELNKLPGKSLIMSSASDKNMSVVSDTKDFWQNLGKGQPAAQAYYNAVLDNHGKISSIPSAVGYIERKTGFIQDARTNCQIFVKGIYDLPKPHYDYATPIKEISAEHEQAKQKSLESRVIKSFLILFSSLLLILMSSNLFLTGNVIGTDNKTNYFSSILLILIIIGIFFLLKHKNKRKTLF